MHHEPDTRGWGERLFAALFHEQNIKWMLICGAAILCGSSLMLVVEQWEQYTPFWKYALFSGFAAGLFLAGRFAYHKLLLHRTGTSLLAASALLLPLNFHALPWIQPGFAVGGLQAGVAFEFWALLITNIVLLGVLGTALCRHFLLRPQPTFLFCYVVLAAAAVFATGLSETAAILAAVGLWACVLVGGVKVNRHVFWLTQQHRLPRVLGFVPVILLGGQFLAVFCLQLSVAFAGPWLGCGLVLIAIPLLLSALALLDVHSQLRAQEPHCDSRRIPVAVVLPVMIGLSLCVAGMLLASGGWPDAAPLVVSAMLTAVVSGTVATRLKSPVIVWMTLLSTLVAYQFSPTFFQKFARLVVDRGAELVRESRLPWAFYGLTYLPVMLICTWISVRRQRANDSLWATPLRQLAVALACLLSVVSLSHIKAIFPVGVVITGLSVWQAKVLQRRQILWLSGFTVVAATYGFPAFAASVLQWPLPEDVSVWSFGLIAAVLTLWGSSIERLVCHGSMPLETGLPADLKNKERTLAGPIVTCLPILQAYGAIAALIGLVSWLQMFGVSVWSPQPLWSLCLVASVLYLHTPRVMALGHLAVIIGLYVAARALTAAETNFSEFLNVILLVLTAASLAMMAVRQRLVRRLEVWITPIDQVVRWCLLTLSLGFVLPISVGIVTIDHLLFAWSLLSFGCWLTVVWTLGWACRSGQQHASILAWLMLLFVPAAQYHAWGLADHTQVADLLTGKIACLWSGLGVIIVGLSNWRSRRLFADRSQSTTDRFVRSLCSCALVTLILLAFGSLLGLTLTSRMAGGLATLGLALHGARPRRLVWRTWAAALASLQVLALTVAVMVPNANNWFALRFADWVGVALPVGLLAGLLQVVWTLRSFVLIPWQVVEYIDDVRQSSASRTNRLHGDRRESAKDDAEERRQRRRDHLRLDAMQFMIILLGLVFWVAMGLAAIAFHQTMTIWQAVLFVLAMGCALLRELLVAIPTQDQDRVWAALGIGLVTSLGLAWGGVIVWGTQWNLFGILAVAVVLGSCGHWSDRTVRFRIWSLPLVRTATFLPLLVVGAAVVRQWSGEPTRWIGLSSLALLFTAGWYFHLFMKLRRTVWLLVSAATLNISLALLWGELSWTDPQLFMIPLGLTILGLTQWFKRDLTSGWTDACRYAAALMILVSPVLQILQGSWWHLFSLMVLSVAVTLLAMILRVRVLIYTGVAFLFADLVAMVVRGSIDQPNVLWVAGVVFGLTVIALAAYCESHREQLQQRIRRLMAELQAWD